MKKENNYYYEPTIKTARKPFIHNETGIKIGEEVTTTYKIFTDDCISKQQLISFLEDKIKEYKEYIDTYKKEKIGNCKLYCEAKLFVYQEILDFVNKGGKK